MHYSASRNLGLAALGVIVTLAAIASFTTLARAQTATSTGTTTSTYVFDAHLSGENEVPPVTATTTASSTPTTATTTATTTGHSRVWFDTTKATGTATTTQMWHALQVWHGVDIFGAHLHCGQPGQNGPVVVDLFNRPTTSPVDVNGTLVATTSITQGMIKATTTGCAVPITNLSDLANALKAGHIYTNVHSVPHPNGVARGQLMLTASSSTTTPPMGTSTPPTGTTTPPTGTTTPTTTPPRPNIPNLPNLPDIDFGGNLGEVREAFRDFRESIREIFRNVFRR